uniref:Uncharacterized protein n=1 Tax=Candidatus Kentrum sp. TUN TaxID=2126343 RepID=A0A450ZNQ6_9GAMM|nr:MAG: hypothetical protein BECKTUN1418F_GA0071002_10306 [Candidatus Kentron sp. TUN]VFK55493.1 MAG: hypothetical protein BECKTUN1418E_GA0071001_10306 [Candidatus Kentron sp. TUN]
MAESAIGGCCPLCRPVCYPLGARPPEEQASASGFPTRTRNPPGLVYTRRSYRTVASDWRIWEPQPPGVPHKLHAGNVAISIEVPLAVADGVRERQREGTVRGDLILGTAGGDELADRLRRKGGDVRRFLGQGLLPEDAAGEATIKQKQDMAGRDLARPGQNLTHGQGLA